MILWNPFFSIARLFPHCPERVQFHMCFAIHEGRNDPPDMQFTYDSVKKVTKINFVCWNRSFDDFNRFQQHSMFRFSLMLFLCFFAGASGNPFLRIRNTSQAKTTFLCSPGAPRGPHAETRGTLKPCKKNETIVLPRRNHPFLPEWARGLGFDPTTGFRHLTADLPKAVKQK